MTDPHHRPRPHTGILAIIGIFIDRSDWGWKLLSGAIGILVGPVALCYPLYSAVLLPALLPLFIGAGGRLQDCRRHGTGAWSHPCLAIFAAILTPPAA